MHRFPIAHQKSLAVASALVAMFLAANLATASRSPVVWQDEVMFADPAVNLYLGHGFTTSAWFQSRDTLFAGNSPLYSLSLYPWLRTFGFSVVAVRAWNYVLVLAAVGACVLGLYRLGLVRTAAPALAFAGLVLCGDGVSYSYRSGRYDCLGMLLVSGLFVLLTFRPGRARMAGLLLVSLLVPWAGLQLLAYLAVLGLALVWIRGRSALADLFPAGLGLCAGLASLIVFFRFQGVWHEFAGSVAILAGTGRPIAQRAASALLAPLTEPSSILVLAALGLLALNSFRRGDFQWRSPLAFGLAAGLLIPGFLACAGKYARYYCWMAYIPMAACVAAEFQNGCAGVLRKAAMAFLLLACAAGLPARLAVTCREWSLRDPDPVGQMVAREVRPSDWVYTEYEAYYPAKRLAALVFLPPYAGLVPGMEGRRPALTASERDRVDLLILKPATEQATLRFFGGRWTLVSQYAADHGNGTNVNKMLGRGSPPYEIHIYRRQPSAVALAR